MPASIAPLWRSAYSLAYRPITSRAIEPAGSRHASDRSPGIPFRYDATYHSRFSARPKLARKPDMHTIGQIAKRFALSRSTLLYYDTIGLLSPSGRSQANYRLYTDNDVRRM